MKRRLNRVRDERGFTLMEMMMAAAIGIVILGVSMGLLDSTMRAFGSSGERTDVAQRGRLAIDVVTQRLRSQFCKAGDTSAVLAADANSVTFWSDLTGSDFSAGNPAAVVRELTLANGVLTETVRSSPGGSIVSQSQLLSDVTTIDGGPLFRYYALAPLPDPPAPRKADVALGAPVGTVDRPRIARITTSFQVFPERSTDAKKAAQFVNDVYVRSIDHSNAQGAIRCVA